MKRYSLYDRSRGSLVRRMAYAQTNAPTIQRPSYETVKGLGEAARGKTWGSTSAVEIDKDGKSIWVASGAGRQCLDRTTARCRICLRFSIRRVRKTGESSARVAHLSARDLCRS